MNELDFLKTRNDHIVQCYIDEEPGNILGCSISCVDVNMLL